MYNTFLDFISSYGFLQFVNVPTRGDNILDLVLSTSSSFLCDVTTVPPIVASDHCVILLHLNTNSCADPPVDNCMPFYNWSDANYGALNDYLQSVNWNFVFFRLVFIL